MASCCALPPTLGPNIDGVNRTTGASIGPVAKTRRPTESEIVWIRCPSPPPDRHCVATPCASSSTILIRCSVAWRAAKLRLRHSTWPRHECCCIMIYPTEFLRHRASSASELDSDGKHIRWNSMHTTLFLGFRILAGLPAGSNASTPHFLQSINFNLINAGLLADHPACKELVQSSCSQAVAHFLTTLALF